MRKRALLCWMILALWLAPGAAAYAESARVVDMVAGVNCSLAVMSDDTLWAWGDTGLADVDLSYAPRKIADGVRKVYSGMFWNGPQVFPRAYFLKTDGSLWGWGYNAMGQLGDGTTASRNAPVKIMDGCQSLSAGGKHTLAVKADGTLWAWGYNHDGVFASGSDQSWRYPREKSMDGVAMAAAGDMHTFALKKDGTLLACGWNYYGRLGDGTEVTRTAPVVIMQNVRAVAAGDVHSFAIKADGSLWGWGRNLDGEIGDGTIGSFVTPPVKVLSSVQMVSGGTHHTVALTTDGGVWTWGSNGSGRLGDGTTADRATPKRVLSNCVKVSAGNDHSLALDKNGVLWAWGDNFYGKVGNGTEEDVYAPIPVLGGVSVTGISVTPEEMTLAVGASRAIAYSVRPAEASNKAVNWRSSNAKVATVDEAGRVKGISEGTATIFCTSVDRPNVYAACAVEVGRTDPLTVVRVQASSARVDLGKSITWSVVAEGGTGALQYAFDVYRGGARVGGRGYASARKFVYKPDAAGQYRVEALVRDAAGATARRYGGDVAVRAKTVAVKKVTLSQKVAVLSVGERLQITATVTPANATNKTLKWKTGDAKVAKVKNGLVTALKRGTVTITATAHNGKKAKLTVRVR